MSVINTMLQDLDRRQGNGAPAAGDAPSYVRAVKPPVERRHWFWATIGVLIAIAVAWIAWMAYQLQPNRLATDLAFKTVDEARTRQAVAPTPIQPAPAAATLAPPPASVATPPPTAPAPAAPAAAAETPSAPQVEMLRLAESIATPITEPKPVAPAAKAEPRPAAAAPSKPAAQAKPASAPAPAATAAAKADKPKLERQDRFGTPAERAEHEFRQAVSVLKLGRSSEAEVHFAKALEFDSSHRGARQALIAIYIERGQLEAARKLLQDGLAIDPGQPEFAIALARIHVERKDLSGALAVLDGSAGAAGDVAEFHVLRGTLLQRLGRHAEAADSYLAALQTRSTVPQAWVGLGISYEQLGKRPEAAEAFRRALAAGPLSTELKTFAEQRIRALR